MAYVVLSRKYRPRTFNEVIGQSHVTATLEKAIESGRVAQAYIFSGTRGTGKTTMARILAKALNCVKGPAPEPCNKCEVCGSIDTGQDVDVIEIDGASHTGVDNIRELRANAAYRPARARFKIYYIDEVHMLSPGAFNALLKTLEEPPEHVKFIFSTTEPHKIPLTVQSRCQRFDFRNISAADIIARLGFICREEGIEAQEGALSLLARFAAGSMRDAESLLDQVVSFSGSPVGRAAVEGVLGVVPTEALSALFGALAAGDGARALEGIETVLAGGTSARQFLAEFIDYLRDVLVAAECGSDSPLLVRSAAEREMIAGDAGKWSAEAIVYAMQLLSETYARQARFPQSRGLLDVSIVKLSRAEDFVRLKDFLADLRSGPSAAGRAKEEPASLPFAQGLPRAPGVPEGLVAAVLDEAAKWGNLAAPTLRQHGVFGLRGDVLKISLPADRKFELDRLTRDEVRRGLETAASHAAGQALRLEIECSGERGRSLGDDEVAAGGAAVERALGEPAVRKVLEIFGGNIVGVEE